MVMPQDDQKWSIYYVLFSASGWTQEAQEAAENLVAQSRSRKKWQTVGIRLLDLAAVDKDLIAWSV
jgi:hypothetical protein